MIKIIEDVGAPATVVVADMLTLELAPAANEWVSYGLTAIGYLGGFLGFGGNFVKNLGVASLPLTARHIYERVKSPVSRKVGAGTSRLVLRSANPGNIQRTYQPEFEPVGPRAF